MVRPPKVWAHRYSFFSTFPVNNLAERKFVRIFAADKDFEQHESDFLILPDADSRLNISCPQLIFVYKNKMSNLWERYTSSMVF